MFAPILEIVEATDACQLLESTTDADRFLLFRRGIDVPMDWDWGIPPAAVERGIENLVGRPRTRWSRRLGGLPRRPASPATVLLAEEHGTATGDDTDRRAG